MEPSLEFDQYPFLKELGLSQENLGCFSGSEFFANGEWITSINPATGRPIAKIREGNLDDYKTTLA